MNFIIIIICGNRLRESNGLRENMETIIEAQDEK
jgi:hypothetical protein